MMIRFFQTHVQPHSPRRSVLYAVIMACVAILAARSWLNAGPAASYAGEINIKSTGPLAAGLLTQIERVDVRHDDDDQWDLVFDVRWTCPDNRIGIESTTGLFVIWCAEQPSRRLEIPCHLMASVTPGHAVTCQLTTVWDDLDATHETLRRAAPDMLRTMYYPHQTVLAVRSGHADGSRPSRVGHQSSRPKVGSKPFASLNAPASSLPR